MTRIIYLCLLFALLRIPSIAQNIYGTSDISIDLTTNAGTADCETDLDSTADDGYYAARVTCVVTDPNGNTVATGADSDDGDVNGYASVTLSFTATAGATYTVTGGHSAAFTTAYDAPDPGASTYFDEDNFLNYYQSVEGGQQEIADGYDWLGPGPQETTRQKTLSFPPTTAVANDATCPTSVTLAITDNEPITLAPSLHTGFGLMAEMNVAPAANYGTVAIYETLRFKSNSCVGFNPVPETQNNCAFTINAAVGSYENQYGANLSYPAKANIFYDEHYWDDTKSDLNSGSCVGVLMQTYTCNGKIIGNFTVTKTLTYNSTVNGGSTVVQVTKQ